MTVADKQLDLAYLAGLFDGEGCIFVQKVDRGGVIPNYIVRVQICMTNKQVIDKVHDDWGGFYLIHKKDQKNPKHKRAYELVWTSKRACTLLDALLPHMEVKRREAELAMQLQQHIDANRGRKWRSASPGDISQVARFREWVYTSLQTLKREPLADIGMVVNSGDVRCPTLMGAEG